jgi:excisionase family DNA binding protein
VIADRQTLSILQACAHVGVSRRTIYNWINSGKVEYVRTAGGAVRIFADSLWRHPSERPLAMAATTSHHAAVESVSS